MDDMKHLAILPKILPMGEPVYMPGDKKTR